MSKSSLAIAYAVKRKSRTNQPNTGKVADDKVDEPNELLGSASDQLRTGDEGFLEADPEVEQEAAPTRESVLERIMSKNRRIR